MAIVQKFQTLAGAEVARIDDDGTVTATTFVGDVTGNLTGDTEGTHLGPVDAQAGTVYGAGVLAIQVINFDTTAGATAAFTVPAGYLATVERAVFTVIAGFDGAGAALTCGVTGGDVDGFLALTDISSGGPQGANDDELGALLWDSANSHKRVSLAGAATVLEFNLTQGTTPTTGQGVLLIYGSLVELPEL